MALILIVLNDRASSKSSPEDYTRVAIQLPARSQPANILKILLLSTSCRRESRKVNWSKLSLRKIDESWIDPIKAWVQDFKLSDNKLTFLPQNFLELKRIVRLNLSVNKLKAIPSDIFSLPCLRDLNISSNEVSELPEPLELKVALKSLNVSNNNLKALPPSISMSSLETLKLSNNNFAEVPLCVCEITSLKDLDLSNNRDINYLPDEMGKLRNLSHLDLTNLDQVKH